MAISIWDSSTNMIFLAPSGLEYLLLAVYGLVAIALLFRSRREFIDLTASWRQTALLLGLLVAPLVTNKLLVVQFSSPALLPPPDIPLQPRNPFVPLLGAFPTLAAAVWVGSGPAFLVGAINGALRAGATTGGITDLFHLAFFGFFVASCLRQDYRGRLEAAIRQPVVASLLAASTASVFLLLSVWAHVTDSGLAGFDYALQVTQVRVGCALLEALLAAASLQLLYLARPSVRPVETPQRVSPLRRSLNRKLLVVVVPLIVIMTLALLYAVTTTTLRGARAQAVRDMARDARAAAEEIPNFIHTGQGLLAEFARDERLLEVGPSRLERLLESNLRMGTFFDQLMMFNPDGQLIAMYPPAPAGDSVLTEREQSLLRRVLENGAPQISSGHESHRDEALVSFLMPVHSDPAEGATLGALLGRTHLQVNPAIGRLLADLQWTSGRGEGFVVDDNGRIVAHPDSGAVLTRWDQERYQNCVPDKELQGLVCDGRDPIQNTRQLLYVLPAKGYPWSVVIRLPYEVVLEQARQVAVPLLALQTVFGVGLVFTTVVLVGRITHPLKRLDVAAERIAAGRLTEPINVDGADEVGRLGTTLEDMRARLKDRMSDLSLLLEVSQAVSSTLDLSTGMSFVLEGALEATGAHVARAVFVTDTRKPKAVISRGEFAKELDKIDTALVAAVGDGQDPFVAEDLARISVLDDSVVCEASVRAAVAFPVRTKERMLAVIWVGYTTVQEFEKSKLDFLSMLSSQVAVLTESARLFQVVESERSRLAAILESASDAVLVTDGQDRVLLVNPAAEQAFSIRSDAVLGRRIEETDLAPEVAGAMTGDLVSGKTPKEVFLPDGRVLYANVSTIKGSKGQEAGRVAVMRDITHFKKLDEMKSEFLATVSHDLRAPLTFMRGYANRLDAVGDLNQTQESYVANILHGVQRIDNLVTDLLDLSRIEAGLGIEQSPCHLGLVLAEAVSGLRNRAAAKGVSLQIRSPVNSSDGKGDVVVRGDRALLRQAIVNLLDNAIKYTPEGGAISAKMSVQRHNGSKQAVITVVDTGIGIAPDEQMRLFEKFYRTKRGSKADASGTGLGLAIVKSIVERHKGRVWVDSKLNEGSRFYISLPLLEAGSISADILSSKSSTTSVTREAFQSVKGRES